MGPHRIILSYHDHNLIISYDNYHPLQELLTIIHLSPLNGNMIEWIDYPSDQTVQTPSNST
jgi:hypothetical protein